MPAEALGARLLREVKEQSLDEILQSLRKLASASPESSISPFDGLLRSQYPPQPPRIVSHVAPSYEPARPLPDFSASKIPTINLTSLQPASGKSQLLYYVLATTILLKQYYVHSGQRIVLPGRKALAIVLDADGRFSALRLRRVLHHILSCHAKKYPPTDTLTEGDIDGIIGQCLSLVHVFRPHSTAQVLEILKSLPAYLLGLSPPSSRYSLGVLVLDSVSSFYWPDRLSQDLARLPPDPTKVPPELPQNLVPQILTSLKSIQSTFACPVIYTSTLGLNPFPPSFPSLTLRLERAPVPRFPPLMSLEEASGGEKETRWTEVAKGRFGAAVMSSNTGAGIAYGGDGAGRKTWMGLRVLEDGVEIEGDEEV